MNELKKFLTEELFDIYRYTVQAIHSDHLVLEFTDRTDQSKHTISVECSKHTEGLGIGAKIYLQVHKEADRKYYSVFAHGQTLQEIADQMQIENFRLEVLRLKNTALKMNNEYLKLKYEHNQMQEVIKLLHTSILQDTANHKITEQESTTGHSPDLTAVPFYKTPQEFQRAMINERLQKYVQQIELYKQTGQYAIELIITGKPAEQFKANCKDFVKMMNDPNTIYQKTEKYDECLSFVETMVLQIPQIKH